MLSETEQAEAARLRAEIREDFRREIERHVEPQRTAARETDKSAIAFAQSTIKTATLLNGGALVAIPAGVALFGIDATAVMHPLIWAAGIFCRGTHRGAARIDVWVSSISPADRYGRRSCQSYPSDLE